MGSVAVCLRVAGCVISCRVGVAKRGGGSLNRATGEPQGDLPGPYSRTVHPRRFHTNLGASEAPRQLPEPILACTEVDERPQQHVPADPGRRVNDGKTAVGHRLGNIAP